MLFEFKDLEYCLGTKADRCICASGSVNNGNVLVVRGPSGVGKSTLLRVLSRLQTYVKGEVWLKGESWLTVPGNHWRAQIHYFSQKPALFDGTVVENLARPFELGHMSGKKFEPQAAKRLMEQLLLPGDLWEQDARTLSGGETARLAFVRSLLIEPTILLLDEPTAALDSNARDAFYRVLSEWLKLPGKGVLLVSHNDDYLGLPGISFLNLEPR